MKKVRVRYAPSPTGLLHIGNARTALFNYIFAMHHKGDFIIRIEDTDVLRNIDGGEESQFRYLSWLGLDWSESPEKGGKYGPYRQLERLELYSKYANELLEKGMAYKEYRENSSDYAIRFKVPKQQTYTFKDMVRGTLKFESEDIEDWIIMKDNGIPTYNFAVVIDDHLMAITHVLRGEEHITNTPKQIMVYETLGWDIPQFGHMTIIVNEQRRKLSKRDHSVVQFISEYEEMGYLPEAMFNFITLLGWSADTNKEILSKEEIINLFDETRLSKAPAMFDKEKLAYINSRYIKMLTPVDMIALCKPFLEKANIVIKSDEWLEQLVLLFQDRMTHGLEIVELYRNFFHTKFDLSEEVMSFLRENNSQIIAEEFKKVLKSADFTVDGISNAIKSVGVTADAKGKRLFMSVRIATTGDMHGPSLPEALVLLGSATVLERLDKTLEKLRGEL